MSDGSPLPGSAVDESPPVSPRERVEAARSPEISAQPERRPDPGTGLCLSGGGYRAMLFHAGVIWRLNELGVLHGLKRVSSVSGGSITAAMLGLRWRSLKWENLGGRMVAADLVPRVIEPLQGLARHTVDAWSIVLGALPGVTVSGRVEAAYRKHLFGNATLQDLPDDRAGEGPRFVLNATNVQSGVLWRFSRPYMADYRVGTVPSPTLALAMAVTASSAFPPVLSPARMKLPPGLVQKQGNEDLHRPPFTTDVYLTDGGVYDNLGLETVWKHYQTVLVSDGGGHLAAQPSPRTDWAFHGLRVNGMIDSQVRSLRKRQVVGSLVAGDRQGAYWRTRSNIAEFPAANTLPCPIERSTQLAELPTRLRAMDRVTQERLINLGYALCDAALRSYVVTDAPAPEGFPFPRSPV